MNTANTHVKVNEIYVKYVKMEQVIYELKQSIENRNNSYSKYEQLTRSKRYVEPVVYSYLLYELSKHTCKNKVMKNWWNLSELCVDDNVVKMTMANGERQCPGANLDVTVS